MVDEIKSIGGSTPAQEHSGQGMKLSDLQKTNAKLYEYFKKQNFKDDSFVYSSDIEKLKTLIDKNQNGKISVKEARKAGFEGSRKEIKSVISSLDTVKNTKIDEKETVPVKVTDNTTDFYQGDKRVRSVYKDDKSEVTTTFTSDGKTPKEVLDVTKDSKGNAIVSKTFYNNGRKNYSETTTDTEQITHIYNPADDTQLKRSVKRPLNSDSSSYQTTEYENGAGLSGKEVITYEGEYVKDGVTQRVIEYDKEGKVISDKTNLDIQNEQSEKAKAYNGNPQKFKVPAGWSVSDIAKAYGISREEVLKANLGAEGVPEYKTNKNGVEYFLKDQEINIPGDAEFNKDYKPAVRKAKHANAGSAAKGATPAQEVKPPETKPTETVKQENNIPRDPNPPKQDISGTLYAQGLYGTGPKNGTRSDINGNEYLYDDKGRLDRVKLKGKGTYSYYYDKNNKLEFVAEFRYTDGLAIKRAPDGTVISYNDKDEVNRYGNGVAMDNQSSNISMLGARTSDFNLPDNIATRTTRSRQRKLQRKANQPVVNTHQSAKEAAEKRAADFEKRMGLDNPTPWKK